LDPILRLKYTVQELHTRFDGDGGHERLAWYGEQRAMGLDHHAGRRLDISRIPRVVREGVARAWDRAAFTIEHTLGVC
jgi:hypothetical protein